MPLFRAKSSSNEDFHCAGACVIATPMRSRLAAGVCVYEACRLDDELESQLKRDIAAAECKNGRGDHEGNFSIRGQRRWGSKHGGSWSCGGL